MLPSMRPLWHPISAVLLTDPPVPPGASALRMLLRAGPLEVRYAGDRMAPALKHGEVLRVRAAPDTVRPGHVVLAAIQDVPDLLRVDAVEGGRLLLRADADPAPGAWVARETVLGFLDVPSRHVPQWRRAVRRAAADVSEAWTGNAESSDGDDVRRKYEAQAPFYAVAGADTDPALLERARRAFAPGGRVLVAGSGVGTECFALAAAGYDVCGLDFAPAMVAAARREAERRGIAVRFLEADLREHREPDGSLAGILFTYDVYSFLADRQERISLLRRMARWLAAGGAILLSARRVRGAWAYLALTVQWLAARGQRRWGSSHTRWLSVRGELHRSFVQVFSPRALRREWRAAGLQDGTWQGGHGLLTVARAA